MKLRAPLAAMGALLFLAGCGSSGGSSTPDACLSPAKAYLSALADAPGQVRLAGGTAISDCFGATQGAGTQADVGQTVVAVATQLNAEARRNPGGPEAVRLGYLVGAVEEGASHSSGIDADLVRRLETAARFNPGRGIFGVAFEHAYGKGYAAGQETG
jgi:hypothetical protein